MKIIASPTESFKTASLTFTRVANAASGDVEYTGFGFKPKSLIIVGCVTTTNAVAIGMASGVANNYNTNRIEGANIWLTTETFLEFMEAAGGQQSAVLKSFDSDGFTITWTKHGNWVADITLHVLAFS